MMKDITLREHLRRAGSVTSEKKARAVRRNGALGGKPPKFEKGDRVRVLEASQAPKARRGAAGIITGPAEARASYRVRFNDGGATLRSWWLEKI